MKDDRQLADRLAADLDAHIARARAANTPPDGPCWTAVGPARTLAGIRGQAVALPDGTWRVTFSYAQTVELRERLGRLRDQLAEADPPGRAVTVEGTPETARLLRRRLGL